MPEEMTFNYAFSGEVKQLLYREKEMAEALGLTREQLQKAIESGQYGLSYHIHPIATRLCEYLFNESSYRGNIQVWNERNAKMEEPIYGLQEEEDEEDV